MNTMIVKIVYEKFEKIKQRLVGTMGFKNQKTLFISAFAIIFGTVLGLVALNYTVEKISKITPPTFAMAEPAPRAPMRDMGADRLGKRKRPPGPDAGGPDMQPFKPFNGQGQRMPPPPAGALRRARSGQEPADIERSPEPNRNEIPNHPPMYQPPPGYPPPQDPRMNDMDDGYYDGPPPYYPPPYGDYDEDYYPPPYEDYGYDPESYLDDIRTRDPKISRGSDREYLDDYYPEPDRQMIDDYLNELYLQAGGQ